MNISIPLIIFLGAHFNPMREPMNDPMAHTCPNPSSLIKTSLNSPVEKNLSEVEQEICTLSTPATASQGNLNVKIHGHYPTIMPWPALDRIPEVSAILTETELLLPGVFMVLSHQYKDQMEPHGKLLTNLL